MTCYLWGNNKTNQIVGDVTQGHSGPTWQQNVELIDKKVVASPVVLKNVEGRSIADVDVGEGHTIVLTEFGEVYTWGRNYEGQLGHGHRRRDITSTSVPQRVKALENENIVSVTCGDFHSTAITENGSLYMWGLIPAEIEREDLNEDHPSTAEGHDETQSTTVTSPDGSITAEQLPGMQATLPLNNQQIGIVQRSFESYVSAGNADVAQDDLAGMRQFSAERRSVAVPRLCSALSHKRVYTVASGFAHLLALTVDGEVYACGYNDRGQLGAGNRMNSGRFQRVLKNLEKRQVVEIACGQHHNIARVKRVDGDTERGSEVFTWGSNSFGQLGLGQGTWAQLSPEKLDVMDWENESIVGVAAGSHHTMCLTAKGVVYSWGHSEYFQQGNVLSHGRDLQNSWHFYVPRKVERLQGVKILKINCGELSNVAWSESGHVYSWGWNGHSELGKGTGYIDLAPSTIPSIQCGNVSKIATGSKHCCILDCASTVGSCAVDFEKFVDSEEYSDIVFVSEEGHEIKAHLCIVAARSKWLEGYINAYVRFGSKEDGGASGVEEVLRIPMDGVKHGIMLSFLHYLYTDRLKPHRVKELKIFAENASAHRLVAMCENMLQRSAMCEIPESSFLRDLSGLLDTGAGSDITVKLPTQISGFFGNAKVEKGENGKELFCTLPVHQVFLCNVDYFVPLLSGNFMESQSFQQTSVLNIKGLFAANSDGDTALNVEAFTVFLKWLYSSDPKLLSSLRLEVLMEVFITANQLGTKKLVLLCEQQLIKLASESNAAQLLDLAQTFGLGRLERQCNILKKS